ncbi:31285_t:CDS:2 [Racocetra persica]|uniref:31285_t:CDS:1 n=1 Tax=Racocetra persica TaxID=160502 RepID=A0ACA9N6U2_9GLOM|nr:31285_t:CDS:2 [Racocetra persica]
MHLESNFMNWTSNDALIDKLIQNCQSKCPRVDRIIEYVPFENFKDIKYKTKGGFGSIYTATWADGWIVDWNEEAQGFIRSGAKEVIIKSLKNSDNLNIEYFKEAMSHIIFSSSNSNDDTKYNYEVDECLQMNSDGLSIPKLDSCQDNIDNKIDNASGNMEMDEKNRWNSTSNFGQNGPETINLKCG